MTSLLPLVNEPADLRALSRAQLPDGLLHRRIGRHQVQIEYARLDFGIGQRGVVRFREHAALRLRDIDMLERLRVRHASPTQRDIEQGRSEGTIQTLNRILGVVGPRRLPYPEVISIVTETARHVTEALSRVRQDLYLPS